jgi:hypothetical protein
MKLGTLPPLWYALPDFHLAKVAELADALDSGSESASHDSREPEKTGSDRSPGQPALAPHGPLMGHSEGSSDTVEAALARALEGATVAQRWDVVAQLARELEARRLAREPNVVALNVRGAKR